MSALMLYNFQKNHELDQQLCLAAASGQIELIKLLLSFGADIHARTCNYSPIFLALKFNWTSVVNYLRKWGANFEATNFTGKFSGFTALHHACLEENGKMVMELLDRYRVDPKIRACDASEPIQLAAFRGRFDIVMIILQHNVSVDTELSYDLFQKYAIESHKWDDNFGNEMTLFTYGIFNSYCATKSYTYSQLMVIHHRPNLRIRDNENKTLLMHVIENDQFNMVPHMVKNLESKDINRIDNAGFSAVHKALIKGTSREFVSMDDKSIAEFRVFNCIKALDLLGANLRVRAKNDPKTSPICLAAYHNFAEIVRFLIRRQTFYTNLERPLFYVNQSYDEYAANNNNIHKLEPYKKLVAVDGFRSCIDDSPLKIVEIIIEDIYVKRLYGHPVHNEEIKLMEQLVEKYNAIKKYVEELKAHYNSLQSEITNIQIVFGRQTMSIYDVLTAPQREYFHVVRRENNYIHANCRLEKVWILIDIIMARMQATRERSIILRKFQLVTVMMIESLLLPYDCIMDIIECLNNDDLESFVEAFSVNTD